MRTCGNISELARELGVDRTVLYHWWNSLPVAERPGEEPFSLQELRKQVRQLKRVVAEKTLEVDFFKGALQKVEARRQGGSGSGETASTTKSEN
jgi:transposase-like protein